MSDRIEIHIAQFFHRFWSVFLCSPEPSWCDTSICFRNGPLISILKPNCSTTLSIAIYCTLLCIHIRFWPGIFSCYTIFISNPAYSCIIICSKQHTICIPSVYSFTFVFLNCLKPLFKGIFLISRATALRSIHPYFYKFSIISIFRIT